MVVGISIWITLHQEVIFGQPALIVVATDIKKQPACMNGWASPKRLTDPLALYAASIVVKNVRSTTMSKGNNADI